jgi:transcriptional regulator with XRE-family HTH domain
MNIISKELSLFLSTTKLKALRTEKGWSQDVVAKSSGLSVRTIQRIEADGKASAESTLAIASVFDLSPKELQATSNHIEVNWTRKMIMKNTLALFIITGVIWAAMASGANIYAFINMPASLFMFLLLYAITLISFGSSGALKSIIGLKYLFTDEMMGGEQAQNLAQIYESQIKFSYGAALVGLILGSIAIHTNLDTTENFTLHRSYAINLIVLLHAAIISEVILRPLSIKLKTCDMNQQLG